MRVCVFVCSVRVCVQRESVCASVFVCSVRESVCVCVCVCM